MYTDSRGNAYRLNGPVRYRQRVSIVFVETSRNDKSLGRIKSSIFEIKNKISSFTIAKRKLNNFFYYLKKQIDKEIYVLFFQERC